jgi:hypothetical protein
LWLLTRLFPGTSNAHRDSQNNKSPDAIQVQQTTAHPENGHRKPSGVTQEHSPRNEGEYKDERIL